MNNNDNFDDFDTQIQSDELAVISGDDHDDFPLPPDGFRTREEWERYCAEQDRRDLNKSIFGIKDI